MAPPSDTVSIKVEMDPQSVTAQVVRLSARAQTVSQFTPASEGAELASSRPETMLQSYSASAWMAAESAGAETVRQPTIAIVWVAHACEHSIAMAETVLASQNTPQPLGKHPTSEKSRLHPASESNSLPTAPDSASSHR